MNSGIGHPPQRWISLEEKMEEKNVLGLLERWCSEWESTPLFGSDFCFGLEEDASGKLVTGGDVDAIIMW